MSRGPIRRDNDAVKRDVLWRMWARAVLHHRLVDMYELPCWAVRQHGRTEDGDMLWRMSRAVRVSGRQRSTAIDYRVTHAVADSVVHTLDQHISVDKHV